MDWRVYIAVGVLTVSREWEAQNIVIFILDTCLIWLLTMHNQSCMWAMFKWYILSINLKLIYSTSSDFNKFVVKRISSRRIILYKLFILFLIFSNLLHSIHRFHLTLYNIIKFQIGYIDLISVWTWILINIFICPFWWFIQSALHSRL